MFTPALEFSLCEVCGDPASLIVPARPPNRGTLWRHAPWSEWRDAIRNGRHFCSIQRSRAQSVLLEEAAV